MLHSASQLLGPLVDPLLGLSDAWDVGLRLRPGSRETDFDPRNEHVTWLVSLTDFAFGLAGAVSNDDR